MWNLILIFYRNISLNVLLSNNYQFTGIANDGNEQPMYMYICNIFQLVFGVWEDVTWIKPQICIHWNSCKISFIILFYFWWASHHFININILCYFICAHDLMNVLGEAQFGTPVCRLRSMIISIRKIVWRWKTVIIMLYYKSCFIECMNVWNTHTHA